MMKAPPGAGHTTTAAFEARARLPSNGIHPGSDIDSISYVDGTLAVLLACSGKQDDIGGMRINFPGVDGFRLLDEPNLVRYARSPGFPRGSHLLEVLAAGWGAEENALQGFECARREWLVVTGNACLSVFCLAEPELAEETWKFETNTEIPIKSYA
ncbi:hypothetical protein [Janthinobacterium sp.]|uniref:hypothetical protein n=1 Tax=Janthinobacterium sp. TaxID=1871054 RepID=UPI0025BCD44D|nr:hypothetical protein [Janthinobacterium sp.]NBV19398.1 hypothetical protein [Janthinobacterium sp.]